MVRVLTAKVPEELIAGIDAAAEARGVTRNRLVREALEAVIEGRVKFITEDERMNRRRRARIDALSQQLRSGKR